MSSTLALQLNQASIAGEVGRIVGNGGIKAIATGELFQQYPAIFPAASAVVSGRTISLTQLVGSKELNFIKTRRTGQECASLDRRCLVMSIVPIVTWLYGGSLIGFRFFPTIMSVSCTALILNYRFHCSFEPARNTIYLQPELAKTYQSITYESRLDAIVQHSSIDSPLVQELDMAFREYRLNVFDAEKLQIKISAIIHRSLQTPELPLPPCPLMVEAEALFKARPDPGLAYGKNIVLIIGQSGVGKSTVISYLYGCAMKAINPLFLRRPIGNKEDKAIIAENGIAEIGHKIGANSSQTMYPQVIVDDKNSLAYCDCPGFNDTRGSAVAISNARSIMDVLSRAAAVRGFLFFIEYNDLESRRGVRCIESMKFLQLLDREYSSVRFRSALFIVTKAPPTAELNGIKEKLTQIIKTVVNSTRGNLDRDLQSFCNTLLASNMLDTHLVICDPCKQGRARRKFIAQIRNLNPYGGRAAYGYPLSPEIFRELDQIKQTIQDQIRDSLRQFRGELHTYWAAWIVRSVTAQESKARFFALEDTLASCKGTLEELLLIAHNPQPALLAKYLDEWKQINELSEKKQNLNELLASSLQEVKEEIKTLKEEARRHYFTITPDPLVRDTPTRSGGCNLL